MIRKLPRIILLVTAIAAAPIVGLAGTAHAASGGGCSSGYPSLQVCISENSNHLIVPDAYANIYEPGGGCSLEIDLYENIDQYGRGDQITGRSGLPCQGYSQGNAWTAAPGVTYKTCAHTADFYVSDVCSPVQTG